MPGETLVDHVYIQIDGTDLTTEEMRHLSFLEVDLTAGMPSMAVIEFHDEKAELIDGAKLKLGKALKISFKQRLGTTATAVFQGEIVTVEPDFAEDQITHRVVALDKMHRMNRASKTQTFIQSTDSDIIQRVAQAASLQVTVTATATTHEQVSQDGISDLAFVQYLARRNGLVLMVDPSTGGLTLKPFGQTDSGVTLKRGQTLITFNPRLSTAAQVTEVTIKGWDMKQKQEIVGVASASTSNPAIGLGQTGIAATQQLFGAQKYQEYRSTLISQAHAAKMAEARLNEINGQFLVAEGTCAGEPKIMPNTKITIQNVGQRFSGTYVVTRVKHRYDLEMGYLCEFTVEGASATTTADLMAPPPLDPKVWSGAYIAVVTNNNDPDTIGRVKLKYPWLVADKESNWARVAMPGAGATRGFYNLPEVNDEVLVVFEDGDFNRPFVIGGLWNGVDATPDTAVVASGKVTKRMWKSRTGHIILLTESDSDSSIEIKTKEGNFVKIDGKNKKIEIDDGNQNKVTMDSAGITLKSPKVIKIDATGNVEIKGASIKVEGTSSVEIKAPSVKIN